MTDATELKHCPFCGGPATTYGPSPGEVYCRKERCAGWEVSRGLADEWNTRAAPTRTGALILAEIERLDHSGMEEGKKK